MESKFSLEQLKKIREERDRKNQLARLVMLSNQFVGGDGRVAQSLIDENNLRAKEYEQDWNKSVKMAKEKKAQELDKSLDDPTSPMAQKITAMMREAGYDFGDLTPRQIKTYGLNPIKLSEAQKQREHTKAIADKKIESKKKDKLDQPLNSQQQIRYDNAVMIRDAVKDMDAALTSGDNTFSIIGDNSYTEASRRAAEAFGRMQSGGAINKDEEKRFLAMLPTMTDSKEMQRKKLDNVLKIVSDRAASLGKPFEAIELSYGSKTPTPGLSEDEQKELEELERLEAEGKL